MSIDDFIVKTTHLKSIRIQNNANFIYTRIRSFRYYSLDIKKFLNKFADTQEQSLNLYSNIRQMYVSFYEA